MDFSDLVLEFETSRGRLLLLADPHLGFEITRGINIRTKFEVKLAEFISERSPDIVVILGDVKDELGLGPFTRRVLEEFFALLGDFDVIITKGNHDGRIENVAEKFENIEVVNYVLIDGALFIHGHQTLPEVEFEMAYLGHIHPAVLIGWRGVKKKVKCFFKIGNFLIIPTVNPFFEGMDVREGIKRVPFLREAVEGEAFLPPGIYLGKLSI
ncbi:metallophosphoesterase [Pyrococcus yayanosii]|uniref:Calcineurin-like phosphoesterase domain-containing protein n=1 Tax=Pyrococcus yayanosii (strain CH1 / JCM 16557) TaxID=529709 RepID=F8AEP2_PYRYC|nr:metallophosphoesterase [Pyrococcus yayanosii]AEH24723.1 hypothetical protein PYCH_10420 [Pyrococcus yayanosii CH1]